MGFLPKHVERNVGIIETLCMALDTPYRIKITIIKTYKENRLRNQVKHCSQDYF